MEPRYGPMRCPDCILTRQEGPYDVFVHMHERGDLPFLVFIKPSVVEQWTFTSMREAMSWIEAQEAE